MVGDVDIQIRLDRQGTPSRLPGGISYDEQLGRFGFGLTVLPGALTQVIVSPLLERSPNFLFTNIVEPVLRWSFVRKDHALVRAAGVAFDGEVILIHTDDDMGQAVSVLCRQEGYAFMADDLIIVDDHGQVYGYPKPVTILQDMVKTNENKLSARNKLALSARRVLYTQFIRRIGLWLSSLDLPAATLNTYLQWLVPQPKHMLGKFVEGIHYEDSARLRQVVVVNGKNDSTTTNDETAVLVERLQQSEKINGFQPHPLLAERLRIWRGEDLMVKEREIIEKAVEKAYKRWIKADSGDWWLELAQEIDDDKTNSGQGTPSRTPVNYLRHMVKPHSEPGIS